MPAKRFFAVFIFIVIAISVISLLDVSLAFPPVASTNSQSETAAGRGGISSLDLTTPIRALEVAGDYAYLTVDGRLLIVDISNPLAPVQLGETGGLLAPLDSPENQLGCSGVANDVAITGDYAYVAADTGGVKIVDVSDPTQPQVVGKAPGSLGSMAVAVEGAFLVEGRNHCDEDGFLSAAVVIYDLSDPLHPVKIGNISGIFPGYGIYSVNHEVDIEGEYAYSQNGDNGVLIVPLTNPAAYQEVIIEPGIFFTNVLAEGQYLYLTGEKEEGGTGRFVVDIADPLNPQLLKSFDGSIGSMASDDGKLYIGSWKNIDAYDLADAANPILFYHFSLGRTIRIEDLDVQDGCVFAGDAYSYTPPDDGTFMIFCMGSFPVMTHPFSTWLPLLTMQADS